MEKSFQSDNFVGKVSNILLIQKEEKKKTRRKTDRSTWRNGLNYKVRPLYINIDKYKYAYWIIGRINKKDLW